MTLIGNGDFRGSASATTEAAVQKKKYSAPADTDFSIIGTNDSSVTVEVATGKEGTFRFGYRTGNGAVVPCEGSLQQGSSFVITPLNRDTEYECYMKRLAETGYTESAWSPARRVTLDKTEINGTVQITGSLAVGNTLQAAYEPGSYAPPGDSDEGGAFVWKLTGGAEAEETHSGNAYTVEAKDRGRTVIVSYTPPQSSKFKGTIERQVGVVVKAPVQAPAVPAVQAVTDTAKGSSLRITNAEPGVWYKALPASEPRPELVLEAEASASGWKKAEAGVLDITGLTVNTDYVVYGARLETESTTASTLTASQKVRSGREELESSIQAAEPLTPMLDTRVTISTYGQAPEGTWYWYASREPDKADSWKLIRTGRAQKLESLSSDTFQLPYDYSGYHIKVVFQADGNYTGEKTWISASAVKNRQISGDVEIMPGAEEEPFSLFEPLTAAYTGTDDQNGSWCWYRRQPDGSFLPIDQKLYQTAGLTSVYTPGEADKGCILKAEYTAASFGCTGSVSGLTGEIRPAKQNVPKPPEIRQSIGTSVQLSDADPSQAKPYGDRPSVLYGYRKAEGENTAGEIQWNAAGESWFRQMEPNTEYEFYAKYGETNVYSESGESQETRYRVENGLITQSGLAIVYESEDDSRLDVGKTIKAVYSGEGYDGGSWKVYFSSGKEIDQAHYQTATDAEKEENSCSYVADVEAIGSSIVFTYTADGINYSGTVTAKTDRAVRKPVPQPPGKPAVSPHQDTEIYLDEVSDMQEYAITETAEPPARYSSLWKVLAQEADGNRRYTHTRLKRNTTYYVHTRIAETESMEVSEAVASDPVTTQPYFGLEAATLSNEQDITVQPKVWWEIDMPETLELNGRLELEAVTLKQAGADGYEAAEPLEPYESFVNQDGSVGNRVYEAGSLWANDHYGSILEVLDSGGYVIGSNREDPRVLSWSGTAVRLRLSLYRANAVTKCGKYAWEILLKDDAGATSLIHGDVEVTTQMQAELPLVIKLMPRNGRELQQIANANSLKNTNGMPVEILVDEKARLGQNMPDFLGKLEMDHSLISEPGAFYMKVAADGTDYTVPDSGVWLNTGLNTSSMKTLVRLGAVSNAFYRVSGIGSRDETAWPWDQEGNDQAYGLTFCYRISEEDQRIYKIWLGKTSQKGGES